MSWVSASVGPQNSTHYSKFKTAAIIVKNCMQSFEYQVYQASERCPNKVEFDLLHDTHYTSYSRAIEKCNKHG